MAPIKSALEIALENTKDVQGDKVALASKKFKDEGMRLAAKLLEDREFNLKDALKAYDKKSLQTVKEGMIRSLLANLVLPFDEFGVKRNKQIGESIASAAPETRKIVTIFSQLDGFFKGYINERQQLAAALEKQYAPRLHKKEEELSKKMGQRVKVNPAQDPEFLSMERQYMGQLDLKYNDELDKVKEMIRSHFLGT